MKINFLFIALTAGLMAGAQQPSKKEMQQLVDKRLKLAVKQYKYMGKILPAGRLPRSYDSVKNELVPAGTECGCRGSY